MAEYDGPSLPAAAKPLYERMRSLGQSVEVLHSNLDNLLGKLEVIMGPPLPEAGHAGPPSPAKSGGSKLSQELLSLETQINNMRSQIECTMSRLEI